MQLETDAARLRDIKAAGGVRVLRQNSPEFWAIFNREYASIAAGDLDIESRAPALTCRSSDVESMAKDDVLTIGEDEYRMLRPEPDSPAPGWTLLILRA